LAGSRPRWSFPFQLFSTRFFPLVFGVFSGFLFGFFLRQNQTLRVFFFYSLGVFFVLEFVFQKVMSARAGFFLTTHPFLMSSCVLRSPVPGEGPAWYLSESHHVTPPFFDEFRFSSPLLPACVPKLACLLSWDRGFPGLSPTPTCGFKHHFRTFATHLRKRFDGGPQSARVLNVECSF